MTANSSDKVTVKQLQSLIPDQAFSKLAADTGVDYQAKVLFDKSMFYLLLYGLAESERTSLRSLEDIFNSRRFIVFKNQVSRLHPPSADIVLQAISRTKSFQHLYNTQLLFV